MDVREKLVELLDIIIQPGQKTIGDIADHLIASGVTVQENVKMSDELLKQLKNAPITICKEEPSIETVWRWIPVEYHLPQNYISVLVYTPTEEPLPMVHEAYIGDDGEWHSSVFYGIENEDVTHWMPMPEPPEEG